MILENIDFGMAVSFLERDPEENIVYRKGWNGKGMFVKICADTQVVIGGETKKLEKHFIIKNVNGTVSTWVPSVNDCLMRDWIGSTLTENKNTVIPRNI
jgi:hypothetical protein